MSALKAPETWVPAVGALGLQIGSADQKLSDWAVQRTPVYGSRRRADRTSDILLAGSGAVWVASGFATPGGPEITEWMVSKFQVFGIEMGAAVITRGIVGDLKAGTDRTRPNGANQSSFPSGHASGASFYMTVASRHVGTFGWSPGWTTAAQFGLGTVAAATAWARVEAQHHYPSDVLAGLSIGHFFGAFLTEAFIGPENPRNTAFLLEPVKHGAVAMIRFNF
jgi:membrane-associated phospholipid phosphatase